ncbi:MAG TPA: VOC family protein [Ilumatobacteraceae bacterium]|nr:VOC family protein [Ilumatobacteraceae bacterium]
MTDAAATPQLQLALDCADPHAQAKFWAAALGYVVEHDGDFVQKMIDEGEELGATRLYDGRQGPHTWVTMADPEGNEFCVA